MFKKKLTGTSDQTVEMTTIYFWYSEINSNAVSILIVQFKDSVLDLLLLTKTNNDVGSFSPFQLNTLFA